MVVRTSAKVLKVKDIAPDVYNLVLRPEHKIEFKAGQYVILQITIDDKPVRRSYSIASREGEEEIILTIKKVKGGIVSPVLHNLKKGDEVILLGPAGHFVLRPTDKTELFIGTGTGVAPLRSMIYASKNNRILLMGHRFEKGVLFKEEFEELQKNNKKFKFYYCTSKENTENGLQGYVQDNIEKIISENPKNYECYVCGLKEMVFLTVKKLEGLGIPRHQIHFERYD